MSHFIYLNVFPYLQNSNIGDSTCIDTSGYESFKKIWFESMMTCHKKQKNLNFQL